MYLRIFGVSQVPINLTHTHPTKVPYKPCGALFFCKHYYKVTMRIIDHEKSPAPQGGAEPVLGNYRLSRKPIITGRLINGRSALRLSLPEPEL